MLEAASLLIYPWQPDPKHGWVRSIADSAGDRVLGAARWARPQQRVWFAWLRGQRVDVVETEDAALLMTLVRPWGLSRIWDLYDAEDRRVGTVAYPVLLDTYGGRRGWIDRHQRGYGKILGPTARWLAEYARQPDQATRVVFAPDLEPNPFLRMLLLGWVLTEERPPGRTASAKTMARGGRQPPDGSR